MLVQRDSNPDEDKIKENIDKIIKETPMLNVVNKKYENMIITSSIEKEQDKEQEQEQEKNKNKNMSFD